MEWGTHMVSGVVGGYVVTGDWKCAMIGGVAAVVSDLDEPKSKFGKVFFPISLFLNRTFGHRTFTHSLLFVLLSSMIMSIVFNWLVGFAVGIGILAHILCDMLTGKVQLLYPLKHKLGISVSRGMYIINDRIWLILMLLILTLLGWNDFNDYVFQN